MLTLPLAPPAASGARYWVAFSGGLDSTVLLHLASAAALPGLSAVHVHHGLQASADDWVAHCEAECRQLGVPLTVQRVTVRTDHPQGPEGAAREARYAALAGLLAAGDVLMTAHHEADQAETLLLRLLRGAALTGLGAMPAVTTLGCGTLWRPLLAVPKADIEHYAATHRLRALDDPHNRDPRYTRSWLRAEILPRLRERFPALDRGLSVTARQLREADAVLEEALREALTTLASGPQALSVAALQREAPARQRLLLRAWIRGRGLPVPGAAVLESLLRDVLAAAIDATPLLSWPGTECRRYRDSFYVSAPLPSLPEAFETGWDGLEPLRLPPGCGELRPAAALEQAVTVRLARASDRIQLAGQSHHQPFKKLAQAAGLPPWVRERMPLLLRGETIVSIAGHWNAAAAPAVHWHPDPLPGLVWPPPKTKR